MHQAVLYTPTLLEYQTSLQLMLGLDILTIYPNILSSEYWPNILVGIPVLLFYIVPLHVFGYVL